MLLKLCHKKQLCTYCSSCIKRKNKVLHSQELFPVSGLSVDQWRWTCEARQPLRSPVPLLTAGECSADSRQVKVLAELPLPPLRTKLSYQRDVQGCSQDEALQKTRHLPPYQTTEAQIFPVNLTAAAAEAPFQSHLSHFSIKQSETSHPVLDAERRPLPCRGVGGGLAGGRR